MHPLLQTVNHDLLIRLRGAKLHTQRFPLVSILDGLDHALITQFLNIAGTQAKEAF